MTGCRDAWPPVGDRDWGGPPSRAVLLDGKPASGRMDSQDLVFAVFSGKFQENELG
jgi:hypothetical protein